MYIWSYDFKSESARALADRINGKIIRHENSTFKGDAFKNVINWGSSDLPREVRKCNILNPENAVACAVNKVIAYQKFERAGVNTVKWTTNKEWAKAWMALGFKILCRTKLEGKDGEGIIIASKPEEICDAKLYAKVEEHAHEFRVTVFRDTVVSVQKKVRLRGVPNHNEIVRTTNGGWGFEVVNGFNIPGTRDACIKAVKALGLDFGGVDVLEDHRYGTVVLEVNTAPHLTPYCADKLAEAVRKVA